ncbi:hypothetical protein TSAR_001491 [Trichomalopsis sarcophagae]|uniref:Peptidase A2 domain-containing protein n=1 Tax=Trichomalopsis sarcophagae TaxID=543379 RepID=A0A232EDM0_9HYME|nr:hypothetical protein TSAR_001491 [Trichomalopsis sarcophagae]
MKRLLANLAKRSDYNKPNDLRQAYKEAVRLETRMEAKIIPDSRPYRGRDRYYNNQDSYNAPQNGYNYRYYKGYRHEKRYQNNQQNNSDYMGTIIEVTDIEEEDIKTIMTTKVDEKAIIITTIMDSNNAINGILGIAMKTGNQQIFDHETVRYYDAPPYLDRRNYTNWRNNHNDQAQRSNLNYQETRYDPRMASQNQGYSGQSQGYSNQNQRHPMQNHNTHHVQNQQMPGNSDKQNYQQQFQAYNEKNSVNSTNPGNNQPKAPVMTILSRPEKYQECAVRIRIPVGTTKPWVEFMIDNGATVNLIKASVLDDDMPIYTADATELGGITNQTVKTHALIYLDIKGTPVKFQIVSDNFSIPFDGLLGRNYLKKEEAVISYYKKNPRLVIRRMRTRSNNPTKKERRGATERGREETAGRNGAERKRRERTRRRRRAVIPAPYSCFNCWQPGHGVTQCNKGITRDFCGNCGRHGVEVTSCPRCA